MDTILLAISDDGLAVDGARAVLSAHGVGWMDGLNCLPDFYLFGAHCIGCEGDRRLHRHEAEEFHYVVLHDVAESARSLVERPATLDADALGCGDLDMIDIVAVPDVFEDAVGEAEDEDVLHRLLAEVVIDAEDLVFVEDLVDLVVESSGGFEVVAERLLDDDTDPVFAVATVAGPGHAVIAEVFD